MLIPFDEKGAIKGRINININKIMIEIIKTILNNKEAAADSVLTFLVTVFFIICIWLLLVING